MPDGEIREKADRFERLLQMIENMRLLELAESRSSRPNIFPHIPRQFLKI